MKNKILFVAPFPPPIHGGALRNESVAKSKLINERFDMQVVPVNQASDVHDIGKFSLKKFIRTFHHVYHLLQKLIYFKPDIVYFNISVYGFALYRDTLYTSLFKLFGRKIVYHLRTQGVREQVENSIFKKWLFEYLFKNTEVICISELLYKDISLVYHRQPFIVNNGIAVVDFTPAGSTKAQNDFPVILFLSNFNRKKGIIELIEALSQLNTQQLGFKAIIVGKDDDYTKTDLETKINTLCLSEKVEVLGPIYDRRKYEIFYAADIFVLPTYFEAFPGVILEAMQFGLPVISTLEGAIPEIVDEGKTGLLVKPKDTHALAEAIKTLLKDENLRKSMGTKGQDKFFAHYTLAQFEQRLASVFERILNQN